MRAELAGTVFQPQTPDQRPELQVVPSSEPANEGEPPGKVSRLNVFVVEKSEGAEQAPRNPVQVAFEGGLHDQDLL